MATGSNPLRRTAKVVDIVALSPRGLSLNDIARAAELPGSTVHRIVKSLVDIDYLGYDGETKIYRLGGRIDRLFHLSLGRGGLTTLAVPILKDLADELGETAFIGRLSDGKVEIAALEMPRSAETTLVHPGSGLPLHATATGKVLLAHQTKDFVDAALKRPLKRFQPGTIVDRRSLRDELLAIRERGYAVHDAEYDPGVYAVAVPVLFGRSQAVFAMAVVGFKGRMMKRFSEAQIARALTGAGKQLAHAINAGAPRA